MLTTNSLSAFSGANTTTPLQQAGAPRLVREQRDQRDQPPVQASPLAKPLPGTAPSGFTPRGSLLNLSV